MAEGVLDKVVADGLGSEAAGEKGEVASNSFGSEAGGEWFAAGASKVDRKLSEMGGVSKQIFFE